MIRFLIYAGLIYLGYRILKPWVASLLGASHEESSADASLEEAELIRDPQCGTYFMRQRGVEARVAGRSLYFCSPECRDKYLVNHTER